MLLSFGTLISRFFGVTLCTYVLFVNHRSYVVFFDLNGFITLTYVLFVKHMFLLVCMFFEQGLLGVAILQCMYVCMYICMYVRMFKPNSFIQSCRGFRCECFTT